MNDIDPLDERSRLEDPFYEKATMNTDSLRGGVDTWTISKQDFNAYIDSLLAHFQSERERLVIQTLSNLYKKANQVKDPRTGIEFKAVHHKDIDYEYWKLTGEHLQ